METNNWKPGNPDDWDWDKPFDEEEYFKFRFGKRRCTFQFCDGLDDFIRCALNKEKVQSLFTSIVVERECRKDICPFWQSKK